MKVKMNIDVDHPQVGQALLSPALEVAVTHLSPDKVILILLIIAHSYIAQFFCVSQENSPPWFV